MSEQKDWRADLKEVGGYENGLTPINAFAVREMIEEIESLRLKVKALESSPPNESDSLISL